MVRSGYIIALMVALLTFGVYQYQSVASVCKVPLSYRIGEFDGGFSIAKDEAKLALLEAESVWEEATGRNLFTYDDNADFTVNFIYDERQAEANQEESFREQLDAAENRSQEINELYTELTEQYDALRGEYQRAVSSYESRLANYNEVVSEYNREGGAPSDVYAELQREERQLESERQNLNALSRQLNQLVAQINEVGERGNDVITRYNQEVETYNSRFGGGEAFTQGDYRGDHINIYTFKDRSELVNVLAHEFGHALSLDHVEGVSSVMYYLMGEQPVEPMLSEFDLAAYQMVCVEGRTLFGFIHI